MTSYLLDAKVKLRNHDEAGYEFISTLTTQNIQLITYFPYFNIIFQVRNGVRRKFLKCKRERKKKKKKTENFTTFLIDPKYHFLISSVSGR